MSVDLDFEFVTHMNLVTTYESVSIYPADDDELSGCPERVQVLPGNRRLLALALVSPSTTGIVVCSSVTASQSPWSPESSEGEKDSREVLWALKY
jgi:hypothetical protein